MKKTVQEAKKEYHRWWHFGAVELSEISYTEHSLTRKLERREVCHRCGWERLTTIEFELP